MHPNLTNNNQPTAVPVMSVHVCHLKGIVLNVYREPGRGLGRSRSSWTTLCLYKEDAQFITNLHSNSKVLI